MATYLLLYADGVVDEIEAHHYTTVEAQLTFWGDPDEEVIAFVASQDELLHVAGPFQAE